MEIFYISPVAVRALSKGMKNKLISGLKSYFAIWCSRRTWRQSHWDFIITYMQRSHKNRLQENVRRAMPLPECHYIAHRRRRRIQLGFSFSSADLETKSPLYILPKNMWINYMKK